MTAKPCKVSGCAEFTEPRSAKGYCRKHYRKWKKYGNPQVVKLGRPLAERLREKVQRGAQGECWPWVGRTNKQGYGIFNVGHTGKVLAHRHVWAMENGPVPPGMNVLHRCDNPPCCNVHHLFLGTQLDNLQDMKRKGRARNQYSKDGMPCA